MFNPFVHLHVHSHYSLLDGAAKLPELVKTASDFKMPAIALTDHGNLFGAMEFYDLAKKANIKPIIGYEAYIAYPNRQTKDKQSREYSHITLLAKNYQGYRNLIKLASEAYLTGFYYRPRIDKELLFQHHEGLIVLSGCLHSDVCQSISKGDIAKAESTIAEYRDLFPGDYYLEIQKNGIEEQDKVNEELLKMSQRFNLPLVFTNDIHYLHKEDAKPHDILLCIQTGAKYNDSDRFKFKTDEFYMKSPEEMYEQAKYFPHAAENTVAIAEKVNIEIPLGKSHLPKYECPGGKTNEEYLRELCEKGLIERYGKIDEALRQKFEYEFSTICNMGFAPYFLIVWDFINYARSQNIGVGPGRGSAAGSVISYALHITNLDPIRYGLIFERFLNEGRKEMPDIDIDFETHRRTEVIEYVSQKYGKRQVCQIITFGTMAARGVIRDVGRALGMELEEVSPIAKKVPEGPKITLEQALKEDDEFRREYENNPKAKEIIDIAKRLEGLARQPGTHAAGVIIADQDITEYCPLYYAKEDKDSRETISTQYSMEHMVNLGLLKMDFLGLNTLTLLEKALKMIKYSRKENIDLEKIPTDDIKTYRMLSRGDTNGVFQLESDGMRELVKKLKPDRFDDLIALVALYRPGPLGSGMVDTFCKCKHGLEPVHYKHPILAEILSETYGVILYQEQVMQISSRMAGFTLTQADKLRKAMGKKRKDIMDDFRKKFVDGAAKLHNVPANIAEEVFDLMDYFSGYGFNKSHSAAYALVSYQTAYLKANYRKEYMAALMSIESEDLEKINKYIHECIDDGIKVLPPDINQSEESFWPTNEGIRFGFAAIKGFGEKAIQTILQTRKKCGKFNSLFDLCEKTLDSKAIDKRALEALTKSGSLDCFGVPREQIFASIADLLQRMNTVKKQKKKNQDAFDFSTEEDSSSGTPKIDASYTKDYPTWSEQEKLNYEKESLGIVFAHPAKRWLPYLQMLSSYKISELAKVPSHTNISIACIVSNIREITIKKDGRNKGRKMAQLVFDDFTGTCAAVCFVEPFEKYSKLLVSEALVFVEGKWETQATNGEMQLIVESVTPYEEALTKLPGKIILEFQNPSEDEITKARDICFKLSKSLTSENAKCATYIRIQHNHQTTAILVSSNLFLSPGKQLIENIEQELGRSKLAFAGKRQ